MAKTCQICGANSGMYPLCPTHNNLKNEGKVVKCPDCGTWHLTEQKCSCQKQTFDSLPYEGFEKCVLCGKETTGYAFCSECFAKHSYNELLEILNNTVNGIPAEAENAVQADEAEEADDEVSFEESDETSENANNVIIINENNKSRCITCGKQTDGLLFCTSCYYKYKDKGLLFKITNCSNVELLDADYEGRYKCKDGHIVKSKSEREIDNYLFEKGIPHAYEKKLSYGATGKEVLKPDFYLPNYLGAGKHVYIEHWGYNENNIHYTKTKKFKMPIYKEKGITLICTHEKSDMGDIDGALDQKLDRNFIKENQINFENPD